MEKEKETKPYIPAVGDSIVCDRMHDKWPVPPGTVGVVTHIDDIGTVFVNWSNGSGLGLIPGTDEYHKI